MASAYCPPRMRFEGITMWQNRRSSSTEPFSTGIGTPPTPDSGGRWKQAQSIGHATTLGAVLQENNWQLVPDPLPPMQMELTSAGQVVRSTGIDVPSSFPDNAFTVPAHTKATVLIDNSHLTTAYPELTVTDGRGATVRLTYAEALIDDKGEKGNRNEIAGKHIQGIFDEFLPDGAANRIFMPLGWKTWRYLQLDIETTDQPLRIEKLRTWFTAYPFEERGHFESRRRFAEADLGDRLAHGPPGRARHLHGYALLRAHAVHWGHANSSAAFLCRGWR